MFKSVFLFLLLIAAGLCGLFQIADPAVPTPTIESPTAMLEGTPNRQPSILLTADRETVFVGEEITVSARTINLGMPQYTYTLSPGVTITVPYGGQGTPSLSPTHLNAPFMILSTPEELASGVIRLRAVNVGSATLGATASGEGMTPEGAFYWTSGASNTLFLSVAPLP